MIANAPAKAFILQIKTHGGYFACDICEVKGVYIFNAVSYENVKAPRRTDESFRMSIINFCSYIQCLRLLVEILFFICYVRSA